jgi:sialate O-acetylesterase
VLVGDVWIAAGQSNMEWPVSWAAKPEAEMAAANYPRIRLVRAMHKVSQYPVDNLVGQMWAPCSPETVRKFSAAGYHFGRELHTRLDVPVGLIQTAWGGTPIEAWTRLGAIASDPALMPVFAEWARMTEEYGAGLAPFTRPAKDAPLPKNAPGSHWMPGGLYNAMVGPITAYPIRGVIWYQGESNTSTQRAPLYGRMLQTLIRDWRRAWSQGDLPFLFVQLANYKSPEDLWPEVREAQRQALGLANTGMAAAIDIGEPENIHPGNKREVGRRLALAARALVYGEKIEYSGPVFRRAAREGAALRVWFDHAEGLRAKGGAVRGFEVAGADGEFAAAEAVIEGDSVMVRSTPVENPRYVRYAWADNPECNLYNAAGLPAAPFRWER